MENVNRIKDILEKELSRAIEKKDKDCSDIGYINGIKFALYNINNTKEQKCATLNMFKDLLEDVKVYKGDFIVANKGAEEFGLTYGEEYEVLEVLAPYLIEVRNDNGAKTVYSVEYFSERRE